MRTDRESGVGVDVGPPRRRIFVIPFHVERSSYRANTVRQAFSAFGIVEASNMVPISATTRQRSGEVFRCDERHRTRRISPDHSC